MEKQLKIDAVTLENPFILAPLAGYSDLAFRRLCREYGAALCYSEMISCHGLVYGQKNTMAMILTHPAERPVAFQLFGSDPDMMGEAAAVLSDRAIDLIDINMGCPVKKVIKKGAGVSLMKNPLLASRIIKKVCENSRVPVTIKIRSGWNHNMIVAEDFARMAEDSGARAVTIHARTWSNGFSGKPDRQVIAAVKQAVTIPVIGNGDVVSYQEGLDMIKATGCDGVMIGRGALGKPWVFDSGSFAPSLTFRLKALKRHLELVCQHHQAEKIFSRVKNHAGKYFKGIHRASGIRQRIYETRTFDELWELIISFHENHDINSTSRRTDPDSRP